MSCNGCRVLRKGCSNTCILRPCLEWIDTAESQAHATAFLAKFFGRAALFSFISAVPDNQRPALFKSLLFEAAGRTVNPVNGAVGLLSSGKWHVCQAAVETALHGGSLKPIPDSSLECTDMFKVHDQHAGLISKVQNQRGSQEVPVSGQVVQMLDLDLTLLPRTRN